MFRIDDAVAHLCVYLCRPHGRGGRLELVDAEIERRRHRARLSTGRFSEGDVDNDRPCAKDRSIAVFAITAQ